MYNYDYLQVLSCYSVLQDLRDFLKRVEPMITAALKSNTQSHAFDGNYSTSLLITCSVTIIIMYMYTCTL